eukprot:scaffold4510_cov183-Amphora_coffeaeformis.AAC.114
MRAERSPSSGSQQAFNSPRRRPSSDNLQLFASIAAKGSAESLPSVASHKVEVTTNNNTDSQDIGSSSNIDHDHIKDHRSTMSRFFGAGLVGQNQIKLLVLVVVCLQNSLFTVVRRYSQGVLREDYSKYECLMLGEIIKLAFSAYMIQQELIAPGGGGGSDASQQSSSSSSEALEKRLGYLVRSSRKMIVLALIYGAMNILSFVALRNIGAGLFAVIAQTKILTTAAFSRIMLQRQYSATKWRALIALVFGVVLFSEPIWSDLDSWKGSGADAQPVLGILAVFIEVSLSGFASIYFEKAIKIDAMKLSIWERNFQLALGSLPVYMVFIAWDNGGKAGFFGGWSLVALLVSILGASGGLLVALSIKYGDAILKTLATTGSIVLASVLDHAFLGGPLTPVMVIAGAQVVIAICNYTFDATPDKPVAVSKQTDEHPDVEMNKLLPEKQESEN